MAYKERVQILTESEQSNFYGPPVLNIEEQRFFFVFFLITPAPFIYSTINNSSLFKYSF